MTASPADDVSSIVTDDVRSWVGRATELMPLPEEITASDVRRYIEATGDNNPIWRDDEAARAAGYRRRAVPPMLVIEIIWRLKQSELGRITDRVPLPAEYTDTRNVDNEIEWLEPVHVGDRLSIRHRILDIVAKASRRGLGVYITRETDYVRDGDACVVAKVRQTVARFPKAKSEAR
jgi:acyl dehydratase